MLFATSTLAIHLAIGETPEALPSRIAAAMDWLGFIHFGWFASGALFYVYYKRRRRDTLALAVCMGLISAFTVRFPLIEKLIHEQIIIRLENILSKSMPNVPAVVSPIPSILLTVALAWFIARFLEPTIRGTFRAIGVSIALNLSPERSTLKDSRP
jgi:hypothetical protein